MLTALALAAALQVSDVYTDDAGCRWKRRPVAAAKAASGAAKRKGHPAKAKPKAEDDEFIGCDEQGFGVWKSDLAELDEIRAEPFIPLEMALGEEAPFPMVAIAPEEPTFAEECNCGVFGMPYPVFFGGIIAIPSPLPPGGTPGGHGIPPIPDAPIWLLLTAGAAVLWAKRRA